MKSKTAFCFILLGFYFACKSKEQKTVSGYPFEIFFANQNSKAKPGEIVIYKQNIAEQPIKEKALLDQYEDKVFKMAPDSTLKALSNPSYDLLRELRLGELGCVKYIKKPGKNYSQEYGQKDQVWICIEIVNILDDEGFKLYQQQIREAIIQSRKEYNSRKPAVETLIKPHFSHLRNLFLADRSKMALIDLNHPLEQNQSNHLEDSTLVGYETKFKVSYIVYDLEGNALFSSFDNSEPYLVELPSSKIPPGWSQLLPQMRVGQSVLAAFPSSLMYGKLGFKGNIHIKPDTDLICYLKIEQKIH